MVGEVIGMVMFGMETGRTGGIWIKTTTGIWIKHRMVTGGT